MIIRGQHDHGPQRPPEQSQHYGQSQRCQRHSRYPGEGVDPAAHCPVCSFKRRAKLLGLCLAILSTTAIIVHEVLSAFSLVDGWF